MNRSSDSCPRWSIIISEVLLVMVMLQWSSMSVASGNVVIGSGQGPLVIRRSSSSGHGPLAGEMRSTVLHAVPDTKGLGGQIGDRNADAPLDISRTNNVGHGGGGTGVDDRSKRFVSPFASMDLTGQAPSNKKYQECTPPAGGRGHCRHIRYCSLPEFREDIWKLVNQMCIIQGTAIGVCCPEGQESQELGGKVINRFPVAGDDEQDTVIWGVQDKPQNNTIQSNFGAVDEEGRPEDRGCGLATKMFPKITGGRPADPGEWPWMAALLTRGPDKAFCGGALVTDRHVVTAAHCTKKYRREELFVRLGEYDFKRYDETNARDFKVTEIREHEDYDQQSYENDIAMLKLNRPTLFTSYIWPICMPPSGESWEGTGAVIIGWGSQFFGGPHSNTLMEVTVPIWPQQDCEGAFVHRIPGTVLCAGAREGGKDSCQGDSGSPLMVQLPNNRWVIAGLVSWGMRCGEADYPGVYTRVGDFVSWIVENSVF